MPHRKTELIVALDFPKPQAALELAKSLAGMPVILKVGSELFLHGGPDLVRELVHQKQRIFLDLKFHDIPNTVAQAAKQSALLHVEMFTLHLAGGAAMIQSVRAELDQIPELRPKVLGVSVLTSFDELKWAQVTRALTGHTAEVSQSVQGLVSHALSWGCDGIVCSPHEVAQVRKSFPALFTVVPGIRPEGSAAQDQARVMTPQEAKLAGASAIVVGRPITQNANPRAVVEKILADIR